MTYRTTLTLFYDAANSRLTGKIQSKPFAILIFFITVSISPLFAYAESAKANAQAAAKEVEKALLLEPDIDRGQQIYAVCATCHLPEGSGRVDGSYPQIAGQLQTVLIKQLADIRAGNRSTPIMLPFAMLNEMTVQDIADVTAYTMTLPMTPDNGVGSGDNLSHGEALYKEHCTDCHGSNGEGNFEKHIPKIHGQHYNYLERQFEWIRDGKRHNVDRDMVEQIKHFSREDVEALMDFTSRLRPPAHRLAKSGWKNPDFPKFVRVKPLPPLDE